MKKGEIYEVHDGTSLGYDKGSLYAWNEGDEVDCFCQSKWQLVEKTWETLEHGDRLSGERLKDLIVQGTMGEIVFYVHDDKYRSAAYSSATDLQASGWKISTPSPSTIEMTLAEAEEKMKLEAGTLRIKD